MKVADLIGVLNEADPDDDVMFERMVGNYYVTAAVERAEHDPFAAAVVLS